jgi:hypothetical protein
MDRYQLYEVSVQDPATLLAFLLRLHGGDPRVLAEDCSGTAALARCFADSHPERRALALDLDAEALRRATHPRVQCLQADLRTQPAMPECDLIHLGNFSVGYLHTRAELIAYLRWTRKRLAPTGVFTLDTYGGALAYQLGRNERRTRLADGSVVVSILERVHADPWTARVVDHLHFTRSLAGATIEQLTQAFEYHWRLWTPMELKEALQESGFAEMVVHTQLDQPWTPASDSIGDSEWVALLAARGHAPV